MLHASIEEGHEEFNRFFADLWETLDDDLKVDDKDINEVLRLIDEIQGHWSVTARELRNLRHKVP